MHAQDTVPVAHVRDLLKQMSEFSLHSHASLSAAIDLRMPILLNLVKSNRFEINHLSRLRTRCQWADRPKKKICLNLFSTTFYHTFY